MCIKYIQYIGLYLKKQHKVTVKMKHKYFDVVETVDPK